MAKYHMLNICVLLICWKICWGECTNPEGNLGADSK